MIAAPPFVAAGWLDGLGPLLLIAFWIARQLMSSSREENAGEPPPPGDDGPPPRPAPRDANEWQEAGADAPPPRPPAPKADDVRSEVEEFLRRAGVQQAEAPAKKPAKQRGPIDPFEEPPRRPPQPKRVEPRRIERPQPEASREDEPTPARQSGERLRHLPESMLAENAAHLGEQIATADDRIEAKLHEKFDHRLGALRGGGQSASPATPAKAEPVNTAGRIKRLLRDPAGVRDAIILSEILNRPADRF